MNWNVDHTAVAQLAETLGLQKPVSVVMRHFDQSYIQGAQQSGPDGHVILVSRDLTPEVANQTICHELKHCHQREMLGEAAEVAYALFLMTAGYQEHPLEQDADEWAAETAPNVQLVRAR